MASLLSMVNRVKHQLRDQTVTALDSSDLGTQALIAMVNQAGKTLLEAEPWPFNHRHDGLAEMKADLTATTSTVTNGSTTVTLPHTLAELTDTLGGRSLRLLVTDDSTYSETSFRLTQVEWSGSAWTGTLETAWPGDTDSGTASTTVYSHEILLPDTVKAVLSVRHEEQPLTLIQVPRHTTFDSYVPRATDQFSDNPSTVWVGGTVQNTTSSHTSVTDGSAATRLGMMVWPIPDSRIFLHYSYVVRYAELSAAGDEWDGVPTSVTDLVERCAYMYALRSEIQKDPQMAFTVERELFGDPRRGVTGRVEKLLKEMQRDPNRRDVGRPFDPGRPGRGFRSRWASQTVPTP